MRQPRNIRVSDELWEQAKRAAATNGTDVSKIIIRFLNDYVAATLAHQRNPAKQTRDYVKFTSEHIPFVDLPKRRVAKGSTVNKDKCTHIRLKYVAGLYWCVDCGEPLLDDADQLQQKPAET